VPLILLALLGCGQGPALERDAADTRPLIIPPPSSSGEAAPPTAAPEDASAGRTGVASGQQVEAGEGSVGSGPPRPEPSTLAPAVGPALVWGTAGVRGYAFGQQTAPNGLEYNQLFSLDLDFNCWLWPAQRLYMFADARFWGQKAAPGVTNASQGVFDFSKRELDFDLGAGWNYFGPLEARAFAYSSNNLNRGTSLAQPSGYADGVGLENRCYLSREYADLGTASFDVARAPFLSLGYYPTKDMIDGEGQEFKPGPFARAYLTWDLFGESCYLYADSEFTGKQSFTPKLLHFDAGVALRPFSRARRVEFRLGTEDTYDLQWHDLDAGGYGEVRLVY
jgi:hypothetical protein